jgi:hypothetical protein
VAKAVPAFNVVAAKKRFTSSAVKATKKSAHNRQKKPWGEISDSLPDTEAALTLFAGYLETASIHRYSKKECESRAQASSPATGTEAQDGVHGTGAADPLPEWTRFASGMDGDNPAIIFISSNLLLAGAYSKDPKGAIIDIPATALTANINLAHLGLLLR